MVMPDVLPVSVKAGVIGDRKFLEPLAYPEFELKVFFIFH